MRGVYTFIQLAKRLAAPALLVALLAGTAPSSSGAATFTYHGTLHDGGKAAQGSYDLELTLYSAEKGGRVIGGPLLLYAVPVRDGSFSTQADFGALANVGDSAWLGVKVRRAGKGEYVALSARSPVSADMTTSTTSVCPGAWTIAGNAGNPAGSYLGTADSQPLTFMVNALQVGQITPASTTYPAAPDVVFGSPANEAALNNDGETISGGGNTSHLCGSAGSSPCGNVVGGAFATIGGGLGNAAYSPVTTIGGGNSNYASGFPSGEGATIGGGEYNIADGVDATIGGGFSNTAAGVDATVAGGSYNQAGGDHSFAAGDSAWVRNAASVGNASGDQGTFVWADSQGVPFVSTGADQFMIRSQGGVAINTTPPNHDVELTIQQSAADVSGQASLFMRQNNATAGALLAAGSASGGNNNATFFVYNYDPAAPGAPAVQELSLEGGNMTLAGTLTTNSDRRIKHDIAPIANAVDTLLRLQPVSFHYNADYLAQSGQPDKPHLGFVAQDYAAVFPEAVISTGQRVPGATPDAAPILALDPNPALITTVAAVQELAVDTRAQEAELAQLREENAALRATLDDLRERFAKIERTSER